MTNSFSPKSHYNKISISCGSCFDLISASIKTHVTPEHWTLIIQSLQLPQDSTLTCRVQKSRALKASEGNNIEHNKPALTQDHSRLENDYVYFRVVMAQWVKWLVEVSQGWMPNPKLTPQCCTICMSMWHEEVKQIWKAQYKSIKSN